MAAINNAVASLKSNPIVQGMAREIPADFPWDEAAASPVFVMIAGSEYMARGGDTSEATPEDLLAALGELVAEYRAG